MNFEYNGQEYGWSNILQSSSWSNGVIEGVTKIAYSEKTDRSVVYGSGGLPHSAAAPGKTEFEGTITLLQSTVQALINALPANKKFVTRMPPFNWAVSYAGEDGIVVTHNLIGIQIKELKHEMKVGDMNMEIELPVVIGVVRY